MTIEPCISVIIPVYNAERYIEKAVCSAIHQDETLEVIMIEDCSKDNSLSICKKIESQYENVFLFSHDGFVNRGAGESRNLGIKHSRGKYVAFLDADDYYLNGRFSNSSKILEMNTDVDGAYEVIGVEYHSNQGRDKHIERMTGCKKNIIQKCIPIDQTGIEEETIPNDLFLHLLKVDRGWIHLNGLLLRKDSLEGFPLFNSNALGQDSEFITRLASIKKLVGTGDFSPVSIRVVHDANRILNKNPNNSGIARLDRNYWLEYALNNKPDSNVLRYLLLRASDSTNKVFKMFKILFLLIKYPKILTKLI